MARNPPSDKSRGIATALAAVFGYFGAHRFYVGKIGTGLLMLFTGGGFGLWYAYDVIVVASGNFRDADGYRLSAWEGAEAEGGRRRPGRDRVLGAEIMEELDALRADMADIQERQDFTERLLTSSSEPAPGDTDDSLPAIPRR